MSTLYDTAWPLTLQRGQYGKIFYVLMDIFQKAEFQYSERGYIWPTYDPSNSSILDRIDFFSPGMGNNVIFIFKLSFSNFGTLSYLDLVPTFTGRPDMVGYDIFNRPFANYLTSDESTRRQVTDSIFSDFGIWTLESPYLDTGSLPAVQEWHEPRIRLYPRAAYAFQSTVYKAVVPMVSLGEAMFFSVDYSPRTPGGTIRSDTGAVFGLEIFAFVGHPSANPASLAPNLYIGP